uniref:Uncharacterized protein n=1 Tax=Geospiza parvula TaxID=87175 RepID=A0A8C3NTT1_GEOPR
VQGSGHFVLLNDSTCVYLLAQVILHTFSSAGRRSQLLQGLPATSTVEENSAAGVAVYNFSVTLSPLASEGVAIINSNPLTEAFAIESKGGLEFRVITTGNPILDYETMPKRFDLQIFVEDTTGRTDLKILTIHVTDKNEHPVFRGNMAIEISREMFSDIHRMILVLFFLFNSYFLNITVTDPDGLNSTRTVNINIVNINDERPYFITKQRIYRIPEEQSPGTSVANITAKDPDDGDSPSRLFYSIQSSDRPTGELQVAGRIDRDALPLRLHPNISMVVRVEDSPSSGRAREMEITIVIEDVNDNPPECNPSAFRKEANENTAPGTFLVDLRNYCKDIDADPSNNQFIFTGLSGFGSNNFALESTGRLVVSHLCSVSSVPSITLNANEIWIFYLSVGSSIGRVHAIDKDWPPNVITYSIVAGAGTRDYTNIFWISPMKGDVRILARLDYETTQKHIFTVQASNQEKSTTVTVNVLEVNDEEPVCSPNFFSLQIPVNLAVGTNINGFRIECQDRDSDPRSFRYFINEGNENSHFTFSPSAGSNTSRLILTSRFDYESGLDTNWVYSLRVHITDDNLVSARDKTTHLTKTGTVTLNIRVIPNPTTATTTTVSSLKLMSSSAFLLWSNLHRSKEKRIDVCKKKANLGVHLVLGGSELRFLKQKGQEAKGPGTLPLPYNWKVKDFGSFINKKRAGINLCLEP